MNRTANTITKTTAVWNHDLVFRVDFPPGESITLCSVPKEERPGPGPSPMDAVQAALAACTGIDVAIIVKKMRKTLSAMRIEVEAVRRDTSPRIYTRLTLVYHVESPDLDPSTVIRAVRLSQDKHCSVAAMLRPTVEFDYRIMLNGEPVPVPGATSPTQTS